MMLEVKRGSQKRGHTTDWAAKGEVRSISEGMKWSRVIVKANKFSRLLFVPFYKRSDCKILMYIASVYE